MENVLTLDCQGFTGNQTKYQGVRKSAQIALITRRSVVQIYPPLPSR